MLDRELSEEAEGGVQRRVRSREEEEGMEEWYSA